MKRRRPRTTQVVLVLEGLVLVGLLQIMPTATGTSNNCYEGLGLESGAIPDDHITATSDTTSASGARLNSATSTWCFRVSDMSSSMSWTVDLGSVRLVSGFQSQGPPTSMFPPTYLEYVGLRVQLSEDGVRFRDCCQNGHMLFYGDDRADSANVITTHSFHGVEKARFVRIAASTGVRWIGDDSKCFRFEILGCGVEAEAGFRPEIAFEAVAEAAGFVETRWKMPKVVIANNEVVELKDSTFSVSETHLEGPSSKSSTVNVTDPGLIVASPFWGADYAFVVKCVIFEDVALDCGSYAVHAALQSAAQSCFSHAADCAVDDRIIFVHPERLAARHLSNGSVLLEWRDGKVGWRVANMNYQVTDKSSGSVILSGVQALQEEGSSGRQRSILIQDLTKESEYSLGFTPAGEGVPAGVQQFVTTLLVMLGPDGSTLHAFVTSVNLAAHVIWSGHILAEWDRAVAVGQHNGGQWSNVSVAGYRIALKDAKSEEILRNTSLSSEAEMHTFGGISMGSAYTVSIVCDFDKQKPLDCGSATQSAGYPLYGTEDSSGATMYVTSGPDTWSGLEATCMASDGHLTSLDKVNVENELVARANLTDFWCGGNMCPDSPAPLDSMWSDGSAQLLTNFDFDSGLDGGHCCVKVANLGHNESVWRGEDCRRVLHGICKFKVTDYLDGFWNASASSSDPTSLNATWTSQGQFWQPQSYVVRACHLRSLSKAAVAVEAADLCHEAVVEARSSPNGRLASAVIAGLQAFSEYNVTLVGSMQWFAKNTSVNFLARTSPSSDVDWSVTSDGTLKISWLRLVADFRDGHRVVANVSKVFDNNNNNNSEQVEGTANELDVRGLELGQKYAFTLVDQDEQTVTAGPFYIEAYPNCTRGLRVGLKCVSSSVRDKTFNGAEADCSLVSRTAKASDSLTEAKAVNEADLRSVPWSQIYGDSALVWIGNRLKAGNSNSNLCPAWSVKNMAVEMAACDTPLRTFCQTDVDIASPAPEDSSVSIRPGPNSIVLDWTKPRESGWKTNYTVKVIPIKLANTSGNASSAPLVREVTLSSSSLPISIESLVPESEYSLVVDTWLGPHLKPRTFVVDSVFTTANNSDMPEEVIGMSLRQGDLKAASLSIYSIILGLIACSILLFFLSGTISVYADNAMQFGYEMCLLGLVLSLLLSVPGGPLAYNKTNLTPCSVAIGLRSLFCLGAFSFLLLESACVANRMVSGLGYAWMDRIRWLVAVGCVVPVIYTVIAVPAAIGALVPNNERVCWVNLSSDASAVLIVPIVLMWSATVFLLLLAIFAAADKRVLIASSAFDIRSETMHMTRYILMALCLLTGLVWALGMSSAHFQREGVIVCFLLFFLVLAALILGLRCLKDSQVRLHLHRLCQSSDSLGELYHTRNGSSMPNRMTKSAYSQHSVTSSHSQRSVTSHMAMPARKMTPVERRGPESPSISANGHGQVAPASVWSSASSALASVPASASAGPTARATSARATSAPSWATTTSSTTTKDHVDCTWHHAQNAIWRELQRSSPRSSLNRKALRQLRRICLEDSTTPSSSSSSVLHYAPDVSLPSRMVSVDDLSSPATYVSPFGDAWGAGPVPARPVLPGDVAAAVRHAHSEPDFSLPNTPDDPEARFQAALDLVLRQRRGHDLQTLRPEHLQQAAFT